MFKAGASRAYLSKSKPSKGAQKQTAAPEPQVDVNVMSVELEFLKQDAEIQNGTPIYCKNCGAALTSNVLIDDNTWKCQFCGTAQELQAEQKNSLPKTETVDYIVETKATTNRAGVIVYCVDVSGSMNGKRLEACKAAICQQVRSLVERNPEQKVCVIEFESAVSILGDCTKKPLPINNKMLNDFDSLVDIGKEKVDLDPLSKTSASIIKTVSSMHTKGCTALGPALLLGTVIAGKEVGGQVILCTDGCANEGLGSMSGGENNYRPFYERVTQLAKDKGVMININTIAGCNSNLKVLGETAAETFGEVLVVDPLNIAAAFNDALDKELIATDVRMNIFLHPSMFLDDNDRKNTKRVVVGNVLDDSAYRFNYHFKPENERSQYGDMEKYPMQIQIEYTKMNGAKGIRVIYHAIEVTDDVKEIEMDGEVLQTFYMQQAAQSARKGDKTEAKKKLDNWKNVQKMAAPIESQQVYDQYAMQIDQALMNNNNNDEASAWTQQASNISRKKAKKFSGK